MKAEYLEIRRQFEKTLVECRKGIGDPSKTEEYGQQTKDLRPGGETHKQD
jgi:hypothetical protein